MTKQRVWIYGDSFSDENYNSKNNVSWPILLSEKYTVVNRSQQGLSPDRLITYLLEDLSNHNVSDDIMLFVMPSEGRFDFEFLLDYSHSHVIHHVPDSVDLYKNQTRFIESFYTLFATDELLKLYLIKNTLVIEQLGKVFKKHLIWPTSDPIDTKFSVSQVLVNLSAISLSEENCPLTNGGEDTRACHLNEENNYIMFELLQDWIDNDIIIDANRFVLAPANTLTCK